MRRFFLMGTGPTFSGLVSFQGKFCQKIESVTKFADMCLKT